MLPTLAPRQPSRHRRSIPLPSRTSLHPNKDRATHKRYRSVRLLFHGNHRLERLILFGRDVTQNRRLYLAGKIVLTRIPRLAILQRRRLTHHPHRTFARVIADRVRTADNAEKRRNINDGGISAFEQSRHCRLHTQKNTGLIHCDRFAPTIQCLTFDTSGMEDAGIVDQRSQAAECVLAEATAAFQLDSFVTSRLTKIASPPHPRYSQRRYSQGPFARRQSRPWHLRSRTISPVPHLVH